jgi:hypothetical protein
MAFGKKVRRRKEKDDDAMIDMSEKKAMKRPLFHSLLWPNQNLKALIPLLTMKVISSHCPY